MRDAHIYSTLLSSLDYLDGVLVLNSSLRASQSKFPLYVFMTSAFFEEHPEVAKILKFHQIPFQLFEESLKLPEQVSNQIRSKRWVNTFDKLQVFGLTEFEKVVFLDCDMLITQNIDSLFTKPHLSFATASEQVSGCEDWTLPNTGMMVIKPEAGLPEKIFKVWPEVQKKKIDFSDQDLIHYYFREKIKEGQEWRVPATYNAFVYLLDKIVKEKGYNTNFKDADAKTISVLHFAIKHRPWLMGKAEKVRFYADRFIKCKFHELKAYRYYFKVLSKL